MAEVPQHWQWFPESRFGMFIHWGPYSVHGRGEQVMLRERLDQVQYQADACRWRPQRFDARKWAAVAKQAGMKYAVLTTRHHDGYCLWDTAQTDYSSAAQAPGRDFVREYVDAFRAEGLRVGLYYSLMDARIPAFWEGPEHDPDGWERFRDSVHAQVRELLRNYGQIDVFWFDGAWPHSPLEWKSKELVDMMRAFQPHILINNRLGRPHPHEIAQAQESADPDAIEDAGGSRELGDFGTPEHQIKAEDRLWESCQVSTWRLWGYTIGEYFRPAELLLDMLVESAMKGGNLLLNVGPQPDGLLPPEFVERAQAIGRWMDKHGECIYGSEGGDVTEFITFGRQIRKGSNLYLILRFWDRRDTLAMPGLATRVRRAVLLTTGQELAFAQDDEYLTVKGLPASMPTDLFPVIRLECDGEPKPTRWSEQRLWKYDPRINTAWAAARGTSNWVDGKER